MSTWELRFESDCAVLTLRKAGEARFYADVVALTIDGERTDYPLDKVEGVRVALPWLPHLLRPFTDGDYITKDTFFRNTVNVTDDFALHPEVEVAFVGADRGWEHRGAKFDGERLWLGVDVYYTLIRGRFGLRAGTWREGVAANFWLRHYKQSPAVVSGGDKYAAWFADLDALPSRWEMDRAWAKVNGLPFDERPHYYGRVVGWEVAAWVVGGLLVVLALTALLDPEAMDVALTLGFFGAVFCALARKLDTMRRRLS